MNDGKDYCVEVQASFLLNSDGSRNPNAMTLSDVRRAFARHVECVFAGDEDIWNNIIGDIEVQAGSQRMQVRYLFASQGKSEMEAESCSARCVREVQKKLEAFGCKLEKLECAAEEVVPARQEQPKEAMPPAPKKKRSGQEH